MISAGQWLIASKIIFSSYNIRVWTVYIYSVFIKTHTQYIIWKYLHVYIYIQIIYIIYTNMQIFYT